MRRFCGIIVVAMAAALGGCGSEGRGAFFQKAMARMFGPSPEQLVKQMFTAPDADLRREAIEQLSRKERGRREPYLRAYGVMVGDPAATVRSAAVRALGRAGDTRYIEKVAEALKDREPTVRWDAAVALDWLVGAPAVKPLSEAAITDETLDVRAAAARAMRHYRRKDVLETLLTCLQDESYSVRYRAAEALRELTGEHAGAELEEWRAILATKADPFGPPVTRPRRKRPWWDWAGMTQRKRQSTAGTKRPARDAPRGRPWWDWAGVTARKDRPTTQAKIESEPKRPARDVPRGRPWWDWMGVTKRKASRQERPEGAAEGPQAN